MGCPGPCFGISYSGRAVEPVRNTKCGRCSKRMPSGFNSTVTALSASSQLQHAPNMLEVTRPRVSVLFRLGFFYGTASLGFSLKSRFLWCVSHATLSFDLLILNLLGRQQESLRDIQSRYPLVWCHESLTVQSGCETSPEGGRQFAHIPPCSAYKSRVTVATLVAVWSTIAESLLYSFTCCTNRILTHNSVLFRHPYVLVCYIARHRCALSRQYGHGQAR